MGNRPAQIAASMILSLSLSLGAAAAQEANAAKEGAHPYDKLGIGFGDLADAATTSWGLNTGLSEGNPLMRPFTDADAFAGSLVGKYALKYSMVHGAGLRPASVNIGVDAVGWGAACANVVTITGGEPILTALAFGGCLVTSYRIKRDIYVADTGLSPTGQKVSPKTQQAAAERLGRKSATKTTTTGLAAHYYDHTNSRFYDARSGRNWIIKNPSNRGYTIDQLLAVVDKLEASGS